MKKKMYWYRPKKVENEYFICFRWKVLDFKYRHLLKKRIIIRMNSITYTSAVAYFPTV